MNTKNLRFRSGSALMVVLGMLSFMLFSGLAFSVYMRESRLPSSFLRRTATTRQLAKAALAFAIEEIDSAVGNNPHPGVGNSTISRNQQSGAVRVGHNRWNHRVFIGSETNAVSEADTVATLTLEGIAYLPPSLIDEIRFYSRHTPTAAWHKFYWDAGRYAYTAIDVSDYFDVNRIRASVPRSSAAACRADFTHLFENGEHTSAPDAGATDKWEEIFESAKARAPGPDDYTYSYEGCVPFLSMADFNLALGTTKIGQMQSGFCDYIANNGKNGYCPAYASGNEGAARAMTFVTDSWTPAPPGSAATGYEWDLSLGGRYQPFPELMMKKKATLADAMLIISEHNQYHPLKQMLPNLGLIELLDYLDVDSRPVSLALPTTERNPMICALNVSMVNPQFVVTARHDPDQTAMGTGGATVTRTTHYFIDGQALLPMVGLKPLALYPFRHRDGLPAGNYRIDGAIKVFLSLAGEDVRLKCDQRPNDGSAALVLAKNPTIDASELAKGAITIPVDSGAMLSIPENASASTIDEAVRNAVIECPSLRTTTGALRDVLSGQDFLTVTRTWQVKTDAEGKVVIGDEVPETATIDAVEQHWPFLHADGTAFSVDQCKEAVLNGADFKVNLAFYLRLSRDGETVDLAPASFHDDGAQFDNPQAAQFGSTLFGRQMGNGPHLLKVVLGPGGDAPVGVSLKPFDLDKRAKAAAPVALAPSVTTMMVADPRFNYDPECWVGGNNGTAEGLKEQWIAYARGVWGAGDGDPFLEVSDQGYLQSVYEIANLARCTTETVTGTGSYPFGDARNGEPCFTANGTFGDFGPSQGWTALRGAGDGVYHQNLMWRSYSPFAINGRQPDDFNGLRVVAGARGGQMVNPYGPATDVEPLMAAFANTPHGWRYASTNEDESVNRVAACDVASYTANFAWNEYSSQSDGRLAWDDLVAIARNFRSRLTGSGAAINWQDAYDDMWDAGIGSLIQDSGSSLLTSADRKFLYGFWHECFVARQQLFLVFIRAEPMMMGGGIIGTAPPQLGARAVALVWRDPTPTPNNEPHRTRVLFYHPLE